LIRSTTCSTWWGRGTRSRSTMPDPEAVGRTT
jgi:hypothetical protein